MVTGVRPPGPGLTAGQRRRRRQNGRSPLSERAVAAALHPRTATVNAAPQRPPMEVRHVPPADPEPQGLTD